MSKCVRVCMCVCVYTFIPSGKCTQTACCSDTAEHMYGKLGGSHCYYSNQWCFRWCGGERKRILRRRSPLLLSAPFNLTIKDIKSVVYDASTELMLRWWTGRKPNPKTHLPDPSESRCSLRLGKPVDVDIIIISFITLSAFHYVMALFHTGA